MKILYMYTLLFFINRRSYTDQLISYIDFDVIRRLIYILTNKL